MLHSEYSNIVNIENKRMPLSTIQAKDKTIKSNGNYNKFLQDINN